MIKSENEEINYKTKISNTGYSAFSDTTTDKGGNNSGFRPHELLEAALASCMNIQIRMYAEYHNIDVTKINVIVKLDRSKADTVIFEHQIDIEGDISESEKEKLIKIAESCPVKQTLNKKIEFINIK